MKQDFMNVRETARYLEVSEATIRNWANKGILHPIRLPSSGFRRFEREQIRKVRKEMAGTGASSPTLEPSWLEDRVREYRQTLDYLHDH